MKAALLSSLFAFGLVHLPSTSFAFIPEASALCLTNDVAVVAGDENSGELWLVDPKTLQEKRVRIANAAWDDMEDLSVVNERQFAGITSQSLTKKGRRKTEREKLMIFEWGGGATDIGVIGEFPIREPLISHLQKSLGANVDGKKLAEGRPGEGGLNVEGLAYHNGVFFLGLREPLSRDGRAIIIPVKVERNVRRQGLKFGTPVLVSLPGASGIRGLNVRMNGLAILAGPVGDSLNGSFDLFQLSFDDGRLTRVSLPGWEKLVRPEAIGFYKQGGVMVAQDFETPDPTSPAIVYLPSAQTGRYRR